MTERVCLVAYHEIGLKGRNRTTFERRLQANLDAALESFPVGPTERVASRLVVPVTDPSRLQQVAEKIAHLSGVGSVAICYRVSQDPQTMAETALTAFRDAGPVRSFKVEAKRSNTNYPETSLEINRRIGAYLQEHDAGPVDLTNPDVTVGVTVTKGDAYIFSRRIPGIGGLPVGSAGTVVSLLSSGIDSPVATWRMMRRGAVAVGVHFSGRPHIDRSSERLVAEIGDVLSLTGGLGRIYIVPFGDIQREIALASPPSLRVLLYRRLMFQVAEEIARMERGRALVTGESLGQVASQTLHNIAAVDDAATMPVLRPLIGSDKLEIMAEARRIGTYDLSIQDAGDCCTLFMPRNPETHARIVDVCDAWDALPVNRFLEEALAALEWLDFKCPAYRPPRQWPTPAGEPGWGVARIAQKQATSSGAADL